MLAIIFMFLLMFAVIIEYLVVPAVDTISGIDGYVVHYSSVGVLTDTARNILRPQYVLVWF